MSTIKRIMGKPPIKSLEPLKEFWDADTTLSYLNRAKAFQGTHIAISAPIQC